MTSSELWEVIRSVVAEREDYDGAEEGTAWLCAEDWGIQSLRVDELTDELADALVARRWGADEGQ